MTLLPKLKISEREREPSLNEGNDHCRPLPLTLSCSQGFLNFETKSMLKFAVSSLSSSCPNLELSWKSRGNLGRTQKNGNENEFEARVHITRRDYLSRASHRFLLYSTASSPVWVSFLAPNSKRTCRMVIYDNWTKALLNNAYFSIACANFSMLK